MLPINEILPVEQHIRGCKSAFLLVLYCCRRLQKENIAKRENLPLQNHDQQLPTLPLSTTIPHLTCKWSTTCSSAAATPFLLLICLFKFNFFYGGFSTV